MTARLLVRATLLLTLLMPGAGTWAQGFHPGTAVRVNGVEISNERFDAFYQEYRAPHGINVAGRGDHLQKLTQLRREALDQMIEQELVRQAAEAQGIEVGGKEIDAALAEVSAPFKTPEEFTRRIETEGFTEDSYREHVGRMIAAAKYLDGIRASVAPVSDAELETYYQDNEHRLTLPEQVRVRHILLTWKPMGTTDDRAAIRKQMAPILDKARAGEDFAALAREYSDDSMTLHCNPARSPTPWRHPSGCTYSAWRSARRRTCCRWRRFANNCASIYVRRTWRRRWSRRTSVCGNRRTSRS